MYTGAGLYAAAGLLEGKTTPRTGPFATTYDPQPPFASGSPDKADAGTLRLAFRMLLGDRPMARRVNHHAAAARMRRARRALSSRRRSGRAGRGAEPVAGER